MECAFLIRNGIETERHPNVKVETDKENLSTDELFNDGAT
jgi:hypothetical protein